MEPLPDDPAATRASLRAKYEKAVSDLLKALRSDPKLTYSSNHLTKLRVTLGSFDPEDQNFLTSNTCLFKPMSSEQIMEYSLDVSKQAQGARDLCNNYDELYQYPTGAIGRHLSDIMDYNTEITFLYLNRHYQSSYKKTKRYPESLAKTSKWGQVRDGNSFSDIPLGLLGGYSLTNQIPPWAVRADYEWQDDYRSPETICPHMMLVMYTGAVAIEGELLFCELGCIAQVIHNRLQQKEFEKTSLFPVLIISLFGPRHGRLIQARFNKSGILKVRASPIYSFVRKDEAPWNLFLRYHACEPRDGPNIEFFDDEGEFVYPQALEPGRQRQLALRLRPRQLRG
ncbi:hypothetical protein P168DRAFT_293330 [Aspergillus campestris IBT 28561]|uniref:Uncharacterized protein n=1 Tax=Aspergillus campestris (strain IBT 28561) TaxID=1392248 RepID=A0A2I1CTK8_ASPC2|nr:uncharacterized protein P168DRAFT_293330 [Aspergillus campestris IBT 28561]PKY00947.1 hypothetical protein P168DRAFT_293330 [Aspergillus campestris IBT 28561]